jgi:hypothetical protein
LYPLERVQITIGGVAVCTCNADQSGNIANGFPNPGTVLGCAASLTVNASSANGLAQAVLTVT